MNNSNKCCVINCNEDMFALNMCKKHYKNMKKIRLVFIHKCCQCAFTNLEAFKKTEKEAGREYKIEVINMFKAKELKLDEQLNFDLESLHNFGYIWLPETDELIQIPVLKDWN